MGKYTECRIQDVTVEYIRAGKVCSDTAPPIYANLLKQK